MHAKKVGDSCVCKWVAYENNIDLEKTYLRNTHFNNNAFGIEKDQKNFLSNQSLELSIHKKSNIVNTYIHTYVDP